jgi:tetratricopeptide (TPR) repeat protein
LSARAAGLLLLLLAAAVHTASAAVPSAELAALAREREPGAVVDGAGRLTHFADTLRWQAKSFAEDLGVDVQVVTLAAPDLAAASVAPQIMDLRRIGEGSPTGGLLLFLNPARREARIEVSYALEAVLPDALCGRIAQDQLAPYAASGMAGMAAMDTLHFLSDFLLQQALDGRLALGAAYKQRPAYTDRMRFRSGGGGASVDWPSAEELAARDYRARVEEPKRARYAPGGDPLASAEAHLRVLRDVAADPTLELYTEGSRCMRSAQPVAPYEDVLRARRLEDSKPWRVIEKGDRAVVTSERPAPGFVPVLLHRVDGAWRVDLAETWKNLFFGRTGEYFTVNATQPYGFGLAAFGAGTPHDVAAFDLGGESVDALLAALGARPGALADFLEGELLFRNCFRAVDALASYETAVAGAPRAPAFADTLAKRAEYLGLTSLAIAAYERLGDDAAVAIARLHLAKGDAAESVEWVERALARNPYDADALAVLASARKELRDAAGARQASERREALLQAPERKDLAPFLRFDPPRPELHIDAPTRVGDVTVYDHSAFGVTIENPSGRPIELLAVTLVSAGTGATSGLGDIRGYWTFPSGKNRLAAHETARFHKTWGFTGDQSHEQLSYLFQMCWRGDGDSKQCRTERIDLFPR